MSLTVAYSASKEDLISPYKGPGFFPAGIPKTEGALCAEMARLAYCRGSSGFAFDRDKVANILSRVGFTKCQFFESVGHLNGGGAHCFLLFAMTERSLLRSCPFAVPTPMIQLISPLMQMQF